MRIEKKRRFPKIESFDFEFIYSETDSKSPYNTFNQHIHNECEIYVNLTGDVAFMVEDKIYPISTGDIIITRPFENHHCIYKSNVMHKHYCIFFSPVGNEEFLDVFFARKVGEENLISLKSEQKEILFNILDLLGTEKLSALETAERFLSLLELISKRGEKASKSFLPNDINEALDVINSSYTEEISVKEIADKCNMSISSLERNFKKYIGMTPRQYIFNKRITRSAELLAAGLTVKETAEQSGFSDYSHFIAEFKKTFGTTPLKYKKKQ